MMKKILILILMLIPLVSNAQSWYTANAVTFTFGNKSEEWQKCDIKILQEKYTVKVFAQETHIYKQVENPVKEEDGKGNTSLSWECVDKEGKKCILYLIFYEGANSIYLMIEYDHFKIYYNMTPDD